MTKVLAQIMIMMKIANDGGETTRSNSNMQSRPTGGRIPLTTLALMPADMVSTNCCCFGVSIPEPSAFAFMFENA